MKKSILIISSLTSAALFFLIFGWYIQLHHRVLRIYNSYPHPEQIGEFGRPAEFISSHLSTITFSYEEPGKTPLLDILGLVQQGKLDGAITCLYYWGDKDPVLYLLSSVPFAYGGFYQLHLLNSAKGKDLYARIGKRHNIVIIPCGIAGIEINAWWRTVPKTLNDLKGMRARIPGMAADIFEKFGIKTRHDLTVTQIRKALHDRVIDIAEWSSPDDDLRQGFYEETPHAMVPGWHEPGTTSQLIINPKVWNSLSKQQQEDIKKACEYSFARLSTLYPILDGDAIVELERRGTIFHQ